MRSVGLAYVLWFFGGVVGVHRFYCDRIGSGILWFLTGGLLGVGWLIDFFLIPGMVREANAKAADEFRAMFPPHPPGPIPATHPHRPQTPSAETVQYPPRPERVVYCTQCGKPMRVPSSSGGASFACPTCNAILRIPA